MKITQVSFYTDIECNDEEMALMLTDLIHTDKDHIYQVHTRQSDEVTDPEDVREMLSEKVDRAYLEKYFPERDLNLEVWSGFPWMRDLKENARFKHFKTGKPVRIVAIACNGEHPQEVDVVYEDATKRVWHAPIQWFCSRVDKQKYPNSTWEWRFEPAGRR